MKFPDLSENRARILKDYGHMDRARLLAQLEKHEGLRLKPYRCTAGKLTIGVGRNLDDVGITEAEARTMLANDVARVELDLDRNLPWWRKLDGVRQIVLVDMCFNMGIGNAKRGLLSFKNTLALIERGDYAAAAKGMLASKWADDVKGRAVTLARMMETGS